MRFRRRAKLFPGVYLNFSKTGISTTIGARGASINIGHKGTYLNTGIPGTGLYDRQRLDGGSSGSGSGSNRQINPNQRTESDDSGALFSVPDESIEQIKSKGAESTTSEGLNDLKRTLAACYDERIDLRKEIKEIKNKLLIQTIIMIFSYMIIIGLFLKWFTNKRVEIKDYLSELKTQLENCYVNIDIHLDPEIESTFKNVHEAFREMTTSRRIWDFTSVSSVDQIATRSAAGMGVTRSEVKFGVKNIDIIKSKYDALFLENANGGDMYLYPAWMAIVDEDKKFGLIDIRELEFNFEPLRFVETENPVSDAKIVGKTWAKVNKNGSPDKRFKDNYEIPICKYGEITLKSNTGLNEAYCISDFDKSSYFAEKLTIYQKLIS